MSRRVNPALGALRHHVTGAVERGEAEPVVNVSPAAPVYVLRLAAERDAALAEAARLREQAAELVAYLSLPKFAGPGNDYVNVADVLTRLGRR